MLLVRIYFLTRTTQLGNTVDVPLPPAHTTRPGPFDPTLNPEGYDLCIECRDDGCFPTLAELRQAQDHISALEQAWQSRYPQTSFNQHRRTLSSPPAAPSSPSPLTNGLSSFSFGSPPPTPSSRGASPPPSASTSTSSFKKYMSWENVESPLQQESKPRPAPHPASIIHLSFPSSPPSIADTTTQTLPLLTFLSKVTTSAAQESTRWSRPLKVLLHSPEGYTDTSVLALAYTMYTLPATLPQAYLHLQNDRNRSFFVHETDLRVLKRLEANLGCRDRAAMLGIESLKNGGSKYPTSRWSAWSRGSVDSPYCPWTKAPSVVPWDRPAQQQMQRKEQRRARSSTAPILYHAPSSDERDQHQAWFDDPRFDGSFPSRVLPFLYLGNLWVLFSSIFVI
jgi:dual specificity MAP kinase phosphatase